MNRVIVSSRVFGKKEDIIIFCFFLGCILPQTTKEQRSDECNKSENVGGNIGGGAEPLSLGHRRAGDRITPSSPVAMPLHVSLNVKQSN